MKTAGHKRKALNFFVIFLSIIGVSSATNFDETVGFVGQELLLNLFADSVSEETRFCCHDSRAGHNLFERDLEVKTSILRRQFRSFLVGINCM